jgi:hypothetical protein
MRQTRRERPIMVYTLVSRSFVVNFKFTSLIYFCAINHVRIFGLCVYATCGGLRFLLPSLIIPLIQSITTRSQSSQQTSQSRPDHLLSCLRCLHQSEAGQNKPSKNRRPNEFFNNKYTVAQKKQNYILLHTEL